MGLLGFATQINWGGNIPTKILQEVLINLQVEARTTLVNDKTCKLIPQNFKELITKNFQLQTTPLMPNKKCINQLVIERSNKNPILTSAMCKSLETKTIINFLDTTFSLKQKTREISWALVQEIQLAMKGETVD